MWKDIKNAHLENVLHGGGFISTKVCISIQNASKIENIVFLAFRTEKQTFVNMNPPPILGVI